MFNMNTIGKRICIIKDNPKYTKKAIYVDPDADSDADEGFSSFHLDQGQLQLVPDPHTERQIIYITGPSGSGKSYFTKEYIKEWQKINRKGEIYVFSALKTDETLDEIKHLKRINIGDNLVEDEIQAEDLPEGSLCIFDDIDVISNKKVRDAVYNILNQILEIGRHMKISCICTNHLSTNGLYTKRILNECAYIVFFPSAGASRGMKYLLTEYMGFDRHMIRRIKKLKSRAVVYHKQYPNFILSQKDIFLLNDDN